ncbi:hypothetical protein JCM15765_21410 [Paradesulfitobacterium aromaticivorans]
MKMLLEKTDEENTVTLNDMIAELERYGITAERKSIYDDIKLCVITELILLLEKAKLRIIL